MVGVRGKSRRAMNRGNSLMSFEPFGYRIDLSSPYSLTETQARLRAGLKPLLEPRSGARGWVLGPLFCLWFTALSRSGPMVFGIISQQGGQTRLSGRAGSDLNGIAFMTLWACMAIAALLGVIRKENTGFDDPLLLAVILFGGLPLLWWTAHRDRRQAEPIVCYMRDAVALSGASLRAQSRAVTVVPGLAVSVGGQKLIDPVTPDLLHDLLIGVGPTSALKVETVTSAYLHVTFGGGDYAIAKAEAHQGPPLYAVHKSTEAARRAISRDVFTFEEAREIVMSYASSAPDPAFLEWSAVKPRW